MGTLATRLLPALAVAAAFALRASAAQQARPPAGAPPAELHLLPVQGTVSMLAGAGANIALQIGGDGVLLVDTPAAALVPQMLAEIRKLSTRPIRYLVNTSLDAEHTGGNAALVGPAAGRGTGGAPFGTLGLNRPAIVAHENVLNRLAASQPPTPAAALPTTTYFLPSMDFSFNGEPVVILHAPRAHTDGDSIVWFRRSDVLAVGDLVRLDRYPDIDVARGGSVDGLIAALDRIVEITVPERLQDGGTRVIVGHGRLCNEADIVEYRDMVAIIRDRVADLVKKGQTLDQVKAARPSRDYDTRYGAGDAITEAIYRSLTEKRGTA
ncbi:MAG TPA: MBL fold metallo-hydrolase [Vicinamibacterales bacterium]|jgi:glyoxylase-like metal-dependent hydrolase (beta-lactamase superfamily II)|nr:MBL fold metallo-hydrolase [Vicinamibacterales bacterium]